MITKDVSEKTHPTLSLEIHDLARGGNGVARQETSKGSRVVFVPRTLPGDLVEVRITKEDKRFAEAEIVSITRPSKDRVQARCEVFGSCGGCTWQHVPYEMQWKTKRDGIRSALSRAQVSFTGEFKEFPAETPWQYRNRIQLRGKGETLGFLGRKSKDIVDISRCEIAREELNQALSDVRDQGRALGTEYKVEIDVLPSGEVRESWNARHGALGFRQVNDEQNEKLKHYVQSAVTDGAHVLDLYGGSGNLSLGLESRVAQVDCVDVGAPENDAEAPAENYHYHQNDAPKWTDRKARELGKTDWKLQGKGIAIIDPPREGLGENHELTVSALEKLGVKKVIAVGCDPDSFARDVSRFQKRGWNLLTVAAFDLFPQTPHIEAVGVLVRD